MRIRKLYFAWIVILALVGAAGIGYYRADLFMAPAIPDAGKTPMALAFETALQRPSLLAYSRRFANEYRTNVELRISDEKQPTRVTQYRIYDALSTRLVRVEDLKEPLQIPHSPCASFKGDGCNYPVSLTLQTSDLPEGFYYTSLVTDSDRLSQVVFFAIRKLARDATASVALMIPENTWQAYNQQGGASFYTEMPSDKKFEISYQRPLPNGAKNDYHNARVLIPLLRMLREQNVAVRMFTNEDLTWEKEYLRGVHLLLIAGHDEYWTTDLRSNVDAFALDGGNIAVFGGNIGWCHVNKGEPGSSNIFLYYGDVQDRDSRYSQSGYPFRSWINNPIEKTLGLTYRFGGYPVRSHYTREEAKRRGISDSQYDRSRGMTVMDEAHPVFANTGLKRGEQFGADAHLMAFEVDGASLFADGSINRTVSTTAPEDLHPIASALLFNANANATFNSSDGHFHSATTIAERKLKSGGHIIHFGSIGWFRAWALGDPHAKRIFLNALNLLGGALPKPTNLLDVSAVTSRTKNAADRLDALRLKMDPDGRFEYFLAFLDETAPGTEIFAELRRGFAVLAAQGHPRAAEVLTLIDSTKSNHLMPDAKQSADEQKRLLAH